VPDRGGQVGRRDRAREVGDDEHQRRERAHRVLHDARIDACRDIGGDDDQRRVGARLRERFGFAAARGYARVDVSSPR